MNRLRILAIVVVSALLMLFAAPLTAQPAGVLTLRDTMSNFDVVNNTGVVANDFHLRVEGVPASQIASLYNNPAFAPPVVIPFPGGFEVHWNPAGPASVTPPGAIRHFGVRFWGNPDPTRIRICMWWTRDGVRITAGQNPTLPWQIWDPCRRRIVDVIRIQDWNRRPFLIRRRVLRLNRAIRLEELTADGPLWREARPIDPAPVLVQPDEELAFDDPALDVGGTSWARPTGLLLGYEVFDTAGQLQGVMINAVNAFRRRTQLVQFNDLSNFDVINNTGISVNDFTIRVFGVTPADITGTYVSPVWGPPVIVPVPGGVDIRYGPGAFVPPGAMLHFGVTFNPFTIDPRCIRWCFFWTLNGQPVGQGPDPTLPRQIWDPLLNRWVDVIFNRGWRGPRRIWVRRWIVRLAGPVELDQLLNDSPILANRIPVDPGPVPIEPEGQLELNSALLDLVAPPGQVETRVVMYETFDDGPGGPGMPLGRIFNAVVGTTQPARLIRGRVRLRSGVPLGGQLVSFALRAAPGGPIVETGDAILEPDGQFAYLTEENGAFEMLAVGRHTLQRLAGTGVVEVGPTGATGVAFELEVGDINEDNVIGLDDFLILAAHYEQSPLMNPSTDLNGDGVCNLDDFLILASNYETAGDD